MKNDEFNQDPLKFATLIAHQLQSPLNAVSAALLAVLGEYTGPLSPPQRGSLERANARCDQAIESVRRMLAIVKAGAGRAATEPPALLVKAVHQAHDSHVAEAARREIGIAVDIRDAAGPVVLGEAALVEVLDAVLGNAIKYTPDRGRVRLRVAAGPRPGTAMVEVADSGIGVPEAERAQIFHPFFRSSTARTSARPGVGLGLAFVKSVVEAAGGSVAVDRSADLGGAAFTLVLPLAPETPARPSGKPPGLRVVIVGGVTAGPKAAAKIIRLLPDTD